jgi:hypothetical protein
MKTKILLQGRMKSRGNYTIRGERPLPKAGTKVMAWLRERGVRQKAAEKFLQESGCETIQDLAVFLRVKLAPLDYANVDSVNAEMRDILGVNGSRAFRIIKDIDLASKFQAPLCSSVIMISATSSESVHLSCHREPCARFTIRRDQVK